MLTDAQSTWSVYARILHCFTELPPNFLFLRLYEPVYSHVSSFLIHGSIILRQLTRRSRTVREGRGR